tara:strand:- start:334 stop:549 length:216 start_codon:yes stop_codon:yes gene_type:complete
MSTKFTEFEQQFIKDSIEIHASQCDREIIKVNGKLGVNSIFAPGFFTMISKDMLTKVDINTKKKKQKNVNK